MSYTVNTLIILFILLEISIILCALTCKSSSVTTYIMLLIYCLTNYAFPLSLIPMCSHTFDLFTMYSHTYSLATLCSNYLSWPLYALTLMAYTILCFCTYSLSLLCSPAYSLFPHLQAS